jgi:hypothetical protein
VMSLSTIIVAVNARMISYRKNRPGEERSLHRARRGPGPEASRAG